jgi:RNA polymerase sigma-70 factor, ECF subfamily
MVMEDGRTPRHSTQTEGGVEGGGAGPSADRETEWIRRATGGDGAAFDALVRTYAGVVERVIGRLASDPDDGADLVQETFLRAWQNLRRFTPGAPFRPWLLTIALNCARDHGRRRRRRGTTVALGGELRAGEEEGALDLASDGPGPDACAESEDLRGRAEAAFARLTPDAQAILWLRVREDLSYDEIATVLGVPAGTVMSRLARAREALRVHLETRVTRETR